jgi:Rod binding domain-containing protein
VSSKGIILPPISVSDVRSSEASEKMKASTQGGRAKIEKAAKDFEAVLLSHWLDQAQQSFATVPGGESDSDKDEDPGRSQFSSLAMQSIGTALSGGRGGLGIAAMVARHLEAKNQSSEPTPMQTKDLHNSTAPSITVGSPEVKK